ncbi:serine hydrolase [Flaviaesturariibacter amylovorans]|uniref:Serine hydrolase n=1 Tax=Flaviaesturariibacter amylovorans TaxID=1084520 RepID=A0ABP8HUQ3_9BACT
MLRPLLLLLLLPASLLAQDAPVALLDSFMKAEAAHKRFNGNVLVARGSKVLYEGSFGYRNFDTKEPLDAESLFDLASVSKQFTAMGILMLREEGRLQLTDSLYRYFPELPYRNVTLHQLLTHTSGLPDYESLMAQHWDPDKIAFNADMIRFLATEKPKPEFAPGAKWSYSNTGYALLASIIEKVSGQPLQAFLKNRIFSPLGMKRSRVYNTRRSAPEAIPNYALGYVWSDSAGRWMIPDSLPRYRYVHTLDGIVGDGVVNATTRDLLRWNRALQAATLLPAGRQLEMLRAHFPVDTTAGTAYGYGVFLGPAPYGPQRYHSGGWPGYTTYLSHTADKDFSIIVLSNNGSNAPAVATALAHLLHGLPVEFPYVHTEIPMETALLERYVGRYTGVGLLELYVQDGKLYRKGRVPVQLKPESATKFFYGDGSDRQLEFATDPDGRVHRAWFINNGIRTELKKLP